jgi:hypothetical protein
MAAAHADAVERRLRRFLQRQFDRQAGLVPASSGQPRQHAGDAAFLFGAHAQQRTQAGALRRRGRGAVVPQRAAATVDQHDIGVRRGTRGRGCRPCRGR